MPEEQILANESSPAEMGNETDYITAIKDLKANSVSKSEYEKLQEENKQLINALANGETITTTVEVEKPSLADLRANLMKEDQTNLEFIKNALALRTAVSSAGLQLEKGISITGRIHVAFIRVHDLSNAVYVHVSSQF